MKRWLIGMTLLVSAPSRAEAPAILSYTGMLTDADTGEPVADSSYEATFSLFTTATGGVASWSETTTVDTVDGVFMAELGLVTAIDETLFQMESDLWLEIAVGGETITPRWPLSSVPWALRAGSAPKADLADGLSAYDMFGECNPGDVVTGIDATTGAVLCEAENTVASSLSCSGCVDASHVSFSYDPTSDTIADDGVIALGVETSGSYDSTADTIADDGVIALGVETSGSYDSTADTIADDNTITLGTETSGSYDSTTDTIADDGVIVDAEVDNALTISSVGNVNWLALSSYPGACASGRAVTALGDAPTCSPFSRIVTQQQSSASGNDPNNFFDDADHFYGPTLTLDIAAGQVVHMVVNKFMGSSAAGGANSLNIYPCYQAAGATAPTPQGGGKFGGQVPQNTRVDWSITWNFSGLAAGTYTFGMCGNVISAQAGNWNNNEWGYISLIVYQP